MINSKEFVIAMLDANSKIFVIHIVIWKQEEILVFFKKQAQIRVKAQVKAKTKAQINILLFHETPIVIPAKYSNYSNVFLAGYIANFWNIPEYIIMLSN